MNNPLDLTGIIPCSHKEISGQGSGTSAGKKLVQTLSLLLLDHNQGE